MSTLHHRKTEYKFDVYESRSQLSITPTLTNRRFDFLAHDKPLWEHQWASYVYHCDYFEQFCEPQQSWVEVIRHHAIVERRKELYKSMIGEEEDQRVCANSKWRTRRWEIFLFTL